MGTPTPTINDPSHKVVGVLLAAGSSRRFGSANKLLATYNHQPMMFHALDCLLESDLEHLIVVLGCDSEHLEQASRAHLEKAHTNKYKTVHFLKNQEHETGMASSLRLAVSTLMQDPINLDISDAPPAHPKYASIRPPAALIYLADMPQVQPETLNTLISGLAIATTTQPTAVNPPVVSALVPTYQGKRGNPVLLLSDLFDSVVELTGDIGARQLLKTIPDKVQEIPVDDPGIFTDYDTPDQLSESQ
ncbi:MAG: nucleotidyltransferase family protein [Gammaproteobacteria bacterium]|nr:nucleotidyltransferase family protein [Gammaproteobacteria bacterium]